MDNLEEVLKRAMPEETKHWIKAAVRYKAALQEIETEIPKTHRDWQGTVALRIVRRALDGPTGDK